MDALSLVLQVLISSVFGLISALLLRRCWLGVTDGLLDEKVKAAFARVLLLLVLAMSVLAGAGPLQKRYDSFVYTFPPLPDTFPQILALLYNTAFAVAVGVYPIAVVVFFAALVFQVAHARAWLGASRQ